ncbi:MAG TPA: hypothetical protein VFC18_17560 [Burkholderiales bacterium]|nr:hypothetical protein [Burkholderiales bacterium]
MSKRSVAVALFLLGAFVSTTGLADGVLALASYGIVERVREVRLTEDVIGLAGVFEHAYKPPSADELLVMLDDGRALTVVHTGVQIFAPRQRVRVILQGPEVRIESAEGHLLP